MKKEITVKYQYHYTEEIPMERFDVCIVGGGLAGLCAAFEAARANANVCMVTKGCVGKASATSMSAGIFSHPTEQMREDDLFRATMEIGRWINDEKLVRKLVSGGKEVPSFLQSLGVKFESKPSGMHLMRERLIFPMIELTTLMKESLKEMGVTFFEHCTVENLVVDGKKCLGIVCLDRNCSPFSIIANATILATGGFCAMFENNDNPVSTTGDGMVMALEAGASLRDLEFVQFFPIAMIHKGLPPFILFPPYPTGARIVNDRGEDILKKRVPEETDLTKAVIVYRDRVCQAIAFEEEKGRKCFLDLSSVKRWDDADMKTMNSMFQLRTYRFPSNNETMIRITCTAHHSMGGIIIDEDCSTGIQGLYAAGEVVGGIHGANRKGGNALADALIFGRIAGANAAKQKGLPVEKDRFETLVSITDNQSRQAEEIPRDRLEEMRETIARTCSKCLGIVRSRDLLSESAAITEKMFVALKNARTDQKSRILLDEVRSMALLAEMTTHTALLRQESRGSHFRKDFPVEDERWLGYIEVSMVDKKPAYSFVPKGGKAA
ncbi:MAG: FAD-dependent oxidoreductase [Methanomassiliicoccales archaeon]|jgi:succinate dehydrogenase/fumarate reductase flavoprotein subunit|nr:FAD-dependent oxidoreductase [Methanomassiliicoccales archaeon]